MVVLLLGPLIVPVPGLEDTVPPEQLARGNDRFVEFDDVTVHYVTSGAGEGQPAFVLLHGFGAWTYSYEAILGELGEVAFTMAYDRPPFGLTTRPLPGERAGPDPYARTQQVDLVIRMLDDQGIGRAVLVGHSAGGDLATAVALEHPERVAGLVLEDAAILTGEADLGGVLRALGRTPQMRRVGRLVARALADRDEEFLERAWVDAEAIPDGTLSAYRLPLRAEHWDVGLWEYTTADHGEDVADRLSDLRVPTLVMTGDQDAVVPPADAERIAERIPDARIAVIPDCGHIPHEERPEEFLQEVLAFYAEVAP